MTRREVQALCDLINREVPGAGFRPAPSEGVALAALGSDALLALACRITGDDPDALAALAALT